jgi:hypothetical protein
MSKTALLPVPYDVAGRQIPFLHDVDGKTIWGTQQQIADVFGVDLRTVNEHLENLQAEGEIDGSTIRKFRIVQNEGSRAVTRQILHYNLRAISAVGFRVKSEEAQTFRSWATDLIEGAVVGRSYETGLADAGLKQMLVAIFQQNADTQRSLVQGHNAVVGEMRDGFVKVGERFIPIEEWQKEKTERDRERDREFNEFRDEVTIRIPEGDRENPSPSILRDHLFIVEKRLHGLCPMCNDKDHPILVPGPLHGTYRWATRADVGLKYSVQHDHYNNVGKASVYSLWPLHQWCHVDKHRLPLIRSQTQFDNWQRIVCEEIPPRKNKPTQMQNFLI